MTPEISRTKRDLIISWHNNGYDIQETARLLRLTPHQVQTVIDEHDRAQQPKPPKPTPPEFTQPHL